MDRVQIEILIDEIEKVLELGDVAYVSPSGDWEIDDNGCQPGHTQSISYDDFQACTHDEIADEFEKFLEYYV